MGVAGLQEATKCMKLFRLPRVLVIHLKRFDKKSSRSKINTTVRYLTLDCGTYKTVKALVFS